MSVTIDAPLETFPRTSPLRRKVERHFGLGKIQRVEYAPERARGHCYWNVLAKVEASGGEAVFGWQVLYWPRVYVVGMHHAVWACPNGDLVDVTEKHRVDNSLFTSFIPDLSPVELTQPIILQNKYYPLSRAEPVANLIDAEIALREAERAQALDAIREGGSYDWRTGELRVDNPNTPQQIERERLRAEQSRRVGKALLDCYRYALGA